jgi:hypothetical protein
MNQPLYEYFELKLTPQQINEAVGQGGGPMIIRNVLLQRADSENRNKRIYPKPILEREIKKYIDTMVRSNRALGELDHDDSPVVNLKNVSHNIKEIYWKGNEVYGDVEILDGPEFPAGRIAAGLLKRGIPVGISSRGMGSTEDLGDGSVKVNDDFNLLTWDLVSFESTQGSNMKPIGLNESANGQQYYKYSKIDEIIREIICNNSGVCSCVMENN